MILEAHSPEMSTCCWAYNGTAPRMTGMMRRPNRAAVFQNRETTWTPSALMPRSNRLSRRILALPQSQCEPLGSPDASAVRQGDTVLVSPVLAKVLDTPSRVNRLDPRRRWSDEIRVVRRRVRGPDGARHHRSGVRTS